MIERITFPVTNPEGLFFTMQSKGRVTISISASFVRITMSAVEVRRVRDYLSGVIDNHRRSTAASRRTRSTRASSKTRRAAN